MTTENNHKARKEHSCSSSCTKQAVKDKFRFQQAEYINRTTVCKVCHIMSLKRETRNTQPETNKRLPN